MKRLCCSAQFVAALALAGCGTVELFGAYDLPESPGIDAAPWPQLVDTPAAPAPGTYTAAVPDPAIGAATLGDLGAQAVVAAVRAEALAEPVLTEAERRAMLARAKRRR